MTCFSLFQVQRVHASGVCSREGRLLAGDRLVTFNGVSLRGVTQQVCLNILHKPYTDISIKVLRHQPKYENPLLSASTITTPVTPLSGDLVHHGELFAQQNVKLRNSFRGKKGLSFTRPPLTDSTFEKISDMEFSNKNQIGGPIYVEGQNDTENNNDLEDSSNGNSFITKIEVQSEVHATNNSSMISPNSEKIASEFAENQEVNQQNKIIERKSSIESSQSTDCITRTMDFTNMPLQPNDDSVTTASESLAGDMRSEMASSNNQDSEDITMTIEFRDTGSSTPASELSSSPPPLPSTPIPNELSPSIWNLEQPEDTIIIGGATEKIAKNEKIDTNQVVSDVEGEFLIEKKMLHDDNDVTTCDTVPHAQVDESEETNSSTESYNERNTMIFTDETDEVFTSRSHDDDERSSHNSSDLTSTEATVVPASAPVANMGALWRPTANSSDIENIPSQDATESQPNRDEIFTELPTDNDAYFEETVFTRPAEEDHYSTDDTLHDLIEANDDESGLITNIDDLLSDSSDTASLNLIGVVSKDGHTTKPSAKIDNGIPNGVPEEGIHWLNSDDDKAEEMSQHFIQYDNAPKDLQDRIKPLSAKQKTEEFQHSLIDPFEVSEREYVDNGNVIGIVEGSEVLVRASDDQISSEVNSHSGFSCNSEASASVLQENIEEIVPDFIESHDDDDLQSFTEEEISPDTPPPALPLSPPPALPLSPPPFLEERAPLTEVLPVEQPSVSYVFSKTVNDSAVEPSLLSDREQARQQIENQFQSNISSEKLWSNNTTMNNSVLKKIDSMDSDVSCVEENLFVAVDRLTSTNNDDIFARLGALPPSMNESTMTTDLLADETVEESDVVTRPSFNNQLHAGTHHNGVRDTPWLNEESEGVIDKDNNTHSIATVELDGHQIPVHKVQVDRISIDFISTLESSLNESSQQNDSDSDTSCDEVEEELFYEQKLSPKCDKSVICDTTWNNLAPNHSEQTSVDQNTTMLDVIPSDIDSNESTDELSESDSPPPLPPSVPPPIPSSAPPSTSPTAQLIELTGTHLTESTDQVTIDSRVSSTLSSVSSLSSSMTSLSNSHDFIEPLNKDIGEQVRTTNNSPPCVSKSSTTSVPSLPFHKSLSQQNLQTLPSTKPLPLLNSFTKPRSLSTNNLVSSSSDKPLSKLSGTGGVVARVRNRRSPIEPFQLEVINGRIGLGLSVKPDQNDHPVIDNIKLSGSAARTGYVKYVNISST